MTKPISEVWWGSKDLPQAFFDIAAQIYHNDPLWLGEDSSSIGKLFSCSHQWFQQGKAYLFLETGQTRLVGFIHPSQKWQGGLCAYFGYFESVDDVSLVRKAFSKVIDWAKREGASALIGPINFNTFFPYRMRTDTLTDSAPFIGEPYNPRYYPLLLEKIGFRKFMGYHSTELNKSALSQLCQSYSERANQALKASGLNLVPMDERFWLANLDQIYEMVPAIFQQNFGFQPITKELFLHFFGRSYAKKLCPLTSFALKGTQDKLAGFFATTADYAPLIRPRDRQQDPLFELCHKTCYPKLTTPQLIAKTVGIHPDKRGQHLSLVLETAMIAASYRHYNSCIGALIRDDNRSASFCRRVEVPIRRYALYCLELGCG